MLRRLWDWVTLKERRRVLNEYEGATEDYGDWLHGLNVQQVTRPVDNWDRMLGDFRQALDAATAKMAKVYYEAFPEALYDTQVIRITKV